MPDVRLQRDNGNLGLRGINTPDDSGDRAVSVDYLNAHSTTNLAHPLNEWDADTHYVIGDQVLYGNTGEGEALRNTFSIYISLTGTANAPNVANRPFSTTGTADQTNWRLVRSGIVAVATDGTRGSGGLTSNTTLHINQGAGIAVTRDGMTFTIASHSSSGSSDVDNFMPGWAYSYFNLIDNTTHTGTIGVRQTGFEIDMVERIGAMRTYTLTSKILTLSMLEITSHLEHLQVILVMSYSLIIKIKIVSSMLSKILIQSW